MPDNPGAIEKQVDALPTVVNLKKELKLLAAAGALVRNAEVKERANNINNELDRITDIVKNFYKTFGKNHWVFSDALSLDRVESILENTNSKDAETAFIEYLKEPNVLDVQINRLNRFPDMRPRLDLLRKAGLDYREGRYYSAVLVVVSVMDGFVNDLNKAERRGLHARTAQEMETEDCAATILAGLPSVQRVFTKSVRKRMDEPLYEVERNALMHGMATNYDNDVIASKAWCMLFAIADWAESSEQIPDSKMEAPSPFETIRKYKELNRDNKRNLRLLNQWTAHEVALSNPSDPDAEVIDTVMNYCDAWKAKNYGRLSDYFPNYINASKGKMAGEARDAYEPHPIDDYKVNSITRPAAATAMVRIRLESTSQSWQAEIRLARLDKNNHPAAEWEPGEWKVMLYCTSPFIDVGAQNRLNSQAE